MNFKNIITTILSSIGYLALIYFFSWETIILTAIILALQFIFKRQYGCKHVNKVTTEYCPYPCEMYEEKECTECGKKFYYDL
jgi:hypothetical protein